MLRLAFALAFVLVLGSTVWGQGQITFPAGFLTTEAPGYSIHFGGRPSMRCQVFNKEHGGAAQTFKEIACRRDGNRDASPYRFGGRSWKDVRVTLGEGSYASASSTFSVNLQSNVRQVFSGSITWPDHSGGSGTSKPHSWAIDVKFPFATPWTYSGNRDVTVDFRFSGGTLANKQFWSSHRPYFLDGIHVTTRVGGSSTNFGTNRCTNAPYTAAAFCVPVMYTYARATGNPRTADRYTFQWWLGRLPPSAPTAVALSLVGNTTGVSINNRCQNYFIGPSIVLFGLAPSNNTSSFYLPTTPFTEKYVSSAVGIKLWTQGAYRHSIRNRLELTRGGYTTIQGQPIPPAGASWMYSTSVFSPVGGRISAESLPLLRLQK
jgi:hypothetical protein